MPYKLQPPLRTNSTRSPHAKLLRLEAENLLRHDWTRWPAVPEVPSRRPKLFFLVYTYPRPGSKHVPKSSICNVRIASLKEAGDNRDDSCVDHACDAQNYQQNVGCLFPTTFCNALVVQKWRVNVDQRNATNGTDECDEGIEVARPENRDQSTNDNKHRSEAILLPFREHISLTRAATEHLAFQNTECGKKLDWCTGHNSKGVQKLTRIDKPATLREVGDDLDLGCVPEGGI